MSEISGFVRASVAAGCAALGALSTFPASATPLVVACVGQQTTTYSPGLTLQPQTAQFVNNGTLNLCLGVGVESASAAFGNFGSGTLACTVQSAVHTNPVYTWADGVTSTLSLDTVTNLNPNGIAVINSVGTVTAGRYLGAAVVRTVNITNLNQTACINPNGPGLTEASGPVTLTFVR